MDVFFAIPHFFFPFNTRNKNMTQPFAAIHFLTLSSRQQAREQHGGRGCQRRLRSAKQRGVGTRARRKQSVAQEIVQVFAGRDGRVVDVEGRRGEEEPSADMFAGNFFLFFLLQFFSSNSVFLFFSGLTAPCSFFLELYDFRPEQATHFSPARLFLLFVVFLFFFFRTLQDAPSSGFQGFARENGTTEFSREGNFFYFFFTKRCREISSPFFLYRRVDT